MTSQRTILITICTLKPTRVFGENGYFLTLNPNYNKTYKCSKRSLAINQVINFNSNAKIIKSKFKG